jgi:hypothetical protein
MRNQVGILAVVFGVCGAAEAQQLSKPSTEKRWEAGASVALIETRPGGNDTPYRDNWYAQGRYAGAIAHYWTSHLKTELEYSVSGEGSRYVQDYVRVNGQVFPYTFESFHQLQQGSLRMVWQFRHNAWVHPYLSAGLVLDAERRRTHMPPQYQPTGRANELIVVRNALDSRERTELRGGVTFGGGAKFYMSSNAFFNTGAIASYSKPAATISLVAGIGIDF